MNSITLSMLHNRKMLIRESLAKNEVEIECIFKEIVKISFGAYWQ